MVCVCMFACISVGVGCFVFRIIAVSQLNLVRIKQLLSFKKFPFRLSLRSFDLIFISNLFTARPFLFSSYLLFGLFRYTLFLYLVFKNFAVLLRSLYRSFSIYPSISLG